MRARMPKWSAGCRAQQSGRRLEPSFLLERRSIARE
jgi:hypothetical protein